MMKNFLALCLALLMITPSLACAMPLCQMTEGKLSAHEPCHDHENSEKKKEGVRFIVDCMGVDLQKADVASYEKADALLVHIDLPVMGEAIGAKNLYIEPQNIRGPPYEWHFSPQDHSIIILTTQRFRI